MPVLSDGTFQPRNSSEILSDCISAIKTHFGNKADVTSASSIRKLLEAAVALPLAETESIQGDIYKQMFFESATGENLDKLLEPFGYVRLIATRATGTVNVTLNTALSTPPQPDPFFPKETLTFVDTSGKKYKNTEDVSVNGTTSLAIKVQADDLGSAGNIGVNSIASVEFANSTVSTRWNDNVGATAFNNNAAFAGGQDKETDRLFRQRVRNSLASKAGANLDGLIVAVEGVSGVGTGGVKGKQNLDVVATADDTVFTFTGTAGSETIDGTTTKLAQKFVTTRRYFVQFVKLGIETDSSFSGNVRIETDSSGSPSGTLVNDRFNKSFTPGGTGVKQVTFDNGDYLAAGTYWVVIERTAGSMVLDAANTGTVDQAKKYSGSWALATYDNLYVEVIGGIPPRAVRLYVYGGTDADVAKAIFKNKAVGIDSYGNSSASVTGRGNQTYTVYFERATEVRVYVDITVKKSAEFNGTTTLIKDLITQYIGGTDSKSVVNRGLGVGETLYRNEVISRILDDDNMIGALDVTVLKIDTVTPPVATGNLVPANSEKLKITNQADITVTLQDA